MARIFAASQNFPLQMLRMLENNLKRERRIFAIVVGLLIFAALCGAAATTVFVLSSGLETDQDAVQAAMRGVNVSVFSRYNMLTPGSMLFELGAVAPKSQDSGLAIKPRCDAYPSGREDQALAAACDAARQSIPEESTPPRL
ncbi:hypothetical protein [Caballeronia grimmiae]|uniref:hypothetical protein n=1 Tax=Caballeronia grimmiae TaxID=1071679 RepID=UPI0038BD00FC